METLLTLTPLSSLSRVRRKRLSEINLADTDGDDADIACCNKKLWHSVQSKRFKSMDFSSNQGSFESPVRMTILLRPNRICHSDEAHRRELKEIDLTPITKLSMNLSDTYLNVEHVRRDLRKGKLKFDMNEENGYKQSICKSFKRFTQSQQLAAERDAENNATTKEKDKLNVKSFQIPRPGSMRRLNMDSSMQDMVIDELSFYDDETTTRDRVFNASPPLMRLLSPEGSPQRFQVVERPKSLQARLVQGQVSKSDKSQKADSISASSKTPAKAFRILQSLSSGSTESSLDDEYKEFFEMESLDQPNMALNFPSNMNSLISGRIIKNSPPKPPETRRPSARRCLSMNENTQQYHEPKTPEAVNTGISGNSKSNSNTPFPSRYTSSCGFKRPDPPSNSCSPIQPKRHRNAEKENLDGSFTGGAGNAPASLAPIPSVIPAYKPTVPLAATNIFRRCISMNDAEIMSALARFDNKDEPDLIGDFSRPFVLPLVEGRHRDLKSISCNTVARLLKGEYDDKVTSYKIIDCRYPYEFEGGHIRGAKNLYTQEQIIGEFLTQKKTKKEHAEASKRHIIIFHCEFSSERGPKLSRFLRNHDRARNTSSYPALDYPEVYLLHNGYKEFFENYADLCEPHAYRPMLEPSYCDEYRHFRSKSKSWNSDGATGTTKRTKKFRSRLMV